jgi:hypothetical protein
MAVTGVNLDPEDSFIDCRIQYDISANQPANQSTVTAYFQVKSSGSVSSSGTARFRVNIKNSSGTVVATATRTSSTTIVNDNTWRNYATASYTFTHSSTGELSFYVGGGVSSGTDPLIGSGWDQLPYEDSALIAGTNFVITPNAPSSAPTLSRSNTNAVADTSTLTLTSSVSSVNSGATPIYQYSYSSTSSTSGFSAFADIGVIGDRDKDLSIAASQQYWVKTRSYVSGEGTFSAESLVATSPGIPDIPIVQSVTKNAKQVSITWTAGSANGSTVSGYRVEGSYDNFSTIHYSANISGATTLSHTTTDLTIAQTYKFRVITVSFSGDSAPSAETAGFFISAYGYRYNGTNFSTAIQSAKIFVGVGGPGADGNGFRTVQSVKRWNGTSWIDLQT